MRRRVPSRVTMYFNFLFQSSFQRTNVIEDDAVGFATIERNELCDGCEVRFVDKKDRTSVIVEFKYKV